MKRALFVANFNSFHRQFNIPFIKRLKQAGYEVSLVSGGPNEFEGIENKYDISFDRTPYHLRNISSFFKLRRVYSTYYDIIYISTSVVGGFARLALVGKKRGRVIYSAHGYNFYKVGEKITGKIYIPVEKVLTRLCDCIFTMNQEDYESTLRYKFPCEEVYNVDGVGIDTSRFGRLNNANRIELKKTYGYDDNPFILFYAAELTSRKNQAILLDVMALLKQKKANVKLLLAGDGADTEKYKAIAKQKGVEDYVDFLGFRKDVPDLLKLSDVLFASSLNEGLPINMIEGMASGLPVVATKVRGHVDLIQEGFNGYLFEIDNPGKACVDIIRLMDDTDLFERMSANAIASSKKYDINNVVPQYDKIWGFK